MIAPVAARITPAALIAKAREWLGVKFLHQGRTRMGCDCLGFICAVLEELGAPQAMSWLPIDYGREPANLLVNALRASCRTTALEPGALLLIQWPQTIDPSHAAIYTGASMIHCYGVAGKVIEHGYRAPWVERTASIWALPGVAYEPAK